MITNIFGKFWGNAELVKLRDSLPQGFELKLYNIVHNCVKNQDITFRERVVYEIVIRYGDQFDLVPLDSDVDISYVSERLKSFVKKHSQKTNQPKNVDELRSTTIQNIKNTLSINNDVIFYDDKKISFELNLYNPSERKRIIAFLRIVDKFVPEVFVNINLNNTNIQQLNALNDRLLEAEVVA